MVMNSIANTDEAIQKPLLDLNSPTFLILKAMETLFTDSFGLTHVDKPEAIFENIHTLQKAYMNVTGENLDVEKLASSYHTREPKSILAFKEALRNLQIYQYGEEGEGKKAYRVGFTVIGPEVMDGTSLEAGELAKNLAQVTEGLDAMFFCMADGQGGVKCTLRECLDAAEEDREIDVPEIVKAFGGGGRGGTGGFSVGSKSGLLEENFDDTIANVEIAMHGVFEEQFGSRKLLTKAESGKNFKAPIASDLIHQPVDYDLYKERFAKAKSKDDFTEIVYALLEKTDILSKNINDKPWIFDAVDKSIKMGADYKKALLGALKYSVKDIHEIQGILNKGLIQFPIGSGLVTTILNPFKFLSKEVLTGKESPELRQNMARNSLKILRMMKQCSDEGVNIVFHTSDKPKGLPEIEVFADGKSNPDLTNRLNNLDNVLARELKVLARMYSEAMDSDKPAAHLSVKLTSENGDYEQSFKFDSVEKLERAIKDKISFLIP